MSQPTTAKYQCGCVSTAIIANVKCPIHGASITSGVMNLDSSLYSKPVTPLNHDNIEMVDIVDTLPVDLKPQPVGLISIPDDVPITIDVAVTILNSAKYRGRDDWRCAFDAIGEDVAVSSSTVGSSDYDYFELSSFEAIAVAEKIMRGK